MPYFFKFPPFLQIGWNCGALEKLFYNQEGGLMLFQKADIGRKWYNAIEGISNTKKERDPG